MNFKLSNLLILIILPFISYTQCLKEPKIYLSPLKEIYEPYDTIKVTFNFLYDRISVNWLSAIEINYSDTWDMKEPFSIPDNCCDSTVFWQWDKKLNNKGEEIQGFFFTDKRVYEDYGDDCLCQFCDFFTDYFSFSWNMYVNDCMKTGDLLLRIDTYADSEFGTWIRTGCEKDEIIRIIKKKNCLISKK